jgi:rhodanese-related sulfurtransferase
MLSRLFGPNVPQMSAAQIQAKLTEKPAPILIDVRQPEEYRSGHISGAKLIPLGNLMKDIREISQNREIICVCQSGSRSQAAAQQLIAAGYSVVNLRGGMDSWERAGFQIKKGS